MSRSGNNVDDDDHNHGGTGNAFEPRELSGYQLKELIWTDWREEWQSRPASPSSIRLIILGRMIEDKSMLRGVYRTENFLGRNLKKYKFC